MCASKEELLQCTLGNTNVHSIQEARENMHKVKDGVKRSRATECNVFTSAHSGPSRCNLLCLHGSKESCRVYFA